MLELKGVTTHYGAIRVLRDVNLQVPAGQITCLLGSNGAGKTTTIRTILGLVKPTSGEIFFRGERIDRLKTAQIIQKGVAVVPEGRRIFPKLRVEENLLIGANQIRDKQRVQRNLKRMYELFPRLEERKHQVAGTLSGGEQQMLAMGRALMSDPQLLLMDEPSLGLAPILIKELFETIVDINRAGVTILLIEQNAHKAIAIAHNVNVMQKGEIVMSNAGNNTLTKEQIHDAYLKKTVKAG
ncbi:MAG: ABC transporter ATP-binding protein [Firmicutes bacterium]|nr:ABC transporter ATP-binding protein [Bacillota bacterium]